MHETMKFSVSCQHEREIGRSPPAVIKATTYRSLLPARYLCSSRLFWTTPLTTCSSSLLPLRQPDALSVHPSLRNNRDAARRSRVIIRPISINYHPRSPTLNAAAIIGRAGKFRRYKLPSVYVHLDRNDRDLTSGRKVRPQSMQSNATLTCDSVEFIFFMNEPAHNGSKLQNTRHT